MSDPILDRRTTRGRELAQQMNKQTIEEKMPKLYFVKDEYNNGYRVGRTDWPGDVFHVIPEAEFDAFRKIYCEKLSMPLLDKTDEE